MKAQKVLAKEKLNILDTFVLTSVITIMGIRIFLELTGYPQIGSDGLHIAHMLYGGIALTLAVLLLLLVEKPNKLAIAVLGGAGFGFFIDEIGKFVTSDNNYFFKPTAVLIYVSVLMIWLVSRLIIVRMNGGEFISDAEWPRHWLVRALVIGWTFINIVMGAVAWFGLTIGGDNVFGFTKSLSNLLPALYFANSIIYCIGIGALWRGDKLSAAKYIRIGALISVVAIYPHIFYDQQFSAMFGLTVTALIIIALSESTLIGMLRPIVSTLKFWSKK